MKRKKSFRVPVVFENILLAILLSGLTRDRHHVASYRASLSTVVADGFE
jgi:hypothetical protein